MRGSHWTDERDERLKALYAEGLSAAKIAAEIGGVTRNAVIGRVHRLDLPRRGSAAPSRAEATKRRRKNRERFEQGKRATKPSFTPAAPRPAPPPPVVVTPEPEPVEEVEPIDFMALTSTHCRWPIGHAAPFRFCGRRQLDGKPYCLQHSRLAYQPVAGRTTAPGPLWR